MLYRIDRGERFFFAFPEYSAITYRNIYINPKEFLLSAIRGNQVKQE